MKNYEASVCRYHPQPLVSVDNDKLRLHNSSYNAQPHSIIVNYIYYSSFISYNIQCIINIIYIPQIVCIVINVPGAPSSEWLVCSIQVK